MPRGTAGGVGVTIRVGLAPRVNTATMVISGETKDSTGVVLGLCTVTLYRTRDDVALMEMVSDAAGVYSFQLAADPATKFFIVAYKAGVPDVAGTTVNTLVMA